MKNSDRMSRYDSTHCDMYNKKYKIVTTKKIKNINCTLDDDLTIKDIAAISIHLL